MSYSTRQRNKALGIVLSAAAAASAGLFSAAPAAASDWKGYAGVNCLSQNNTDAVRRSAVGQPALANSGTSTLTVYCPVVRDVEVGGDNRVKAVAVRVRNRHSTGNITCEFSSFNQDGVKIDTKTGVLPPDPVDHDVEDDIRLGPLNAHNWGSYVLLCQLPGRHATNNLQSYLINYRVDEEQ